MAWDEFDFRDPVLGKKENTNQFHFGLIMKRFQEAAKSENGFLREPRFKCIEANDSLEMCCPIRNGINMSSAQLKIFQ